jgi:hypothetical protein
MDDRIVGAWFPAETEVLLFTAVSEPGAHPTSYQEVLEDIFSGSKEVGVWSSPLAPLLMPNHSPIHRYVVIIKRKASLAFIYVNTSLWRLCRPLEVTVNYCCSFYTWPVSAECAVDLVASACGSVVSWGIMLEAGRSRVRFPMRSLNFSVTLILPTALWPWSWASL